MPVGSGPSSFTLKYHSMHVIHLENQAGLSDFLFLPVLLLFHTHTEPTPHTWSVPYNKHLIGLDIGAIREIDSEATCPSHRHVWSESRNDLASTATIIRKEMMYHASVSLNDHSAIPNQTMRFFLPSQAL